MKLPQYEQQLQAPQKEVVQPIEQAFGIQTAQAKQGLAEGIQQAASNIGNRLQEMEYNNQELKANKILLAFEQKDMMKPNDILAKTGTNANGGTTEYTKWYDEESKRVLKDIPDRFREHVSLNLGERHIQGQDQVSTHELTQQRAVTIDTIQSRLLLNQQNAFQNQTDANLFLQTKSSNDLFDQQAKVIGEAPEVTEAKKMKWKQDTLRGVVTNFIESDDLDSAMNALKNNSEMIGGEKSQGYTELQTKIDNLQFTRDVSNTAQSLASDYYGKPNGMEAGLKEIEGMYKDLDPQKRAKRIAVLDSEYRKVMGIYEQ